MRTSLLAWVSACLLASAHASQRGYVLDESGDYRYHKKPCNIPCNEGSCSYRECPYDALSEHKPPSCTGGSCKFVDVDGPSCGGGGCVFVRCTAAACGGGGCHHVNPRDSLRDHYCLGGGCLHNGEKIPQTLNAVLSM